MEKNGPSRPSCLALRYCNMHSFADFASWRLGTRPCKMRIAARTKMQRNGPGCRGQCSGPGFAKQGGLLVRVCSANTFRLLGLTAAL